MQTLLAHHIDDSGLKSHEATSFKSLVCTLLSPFQVLSTRIQHEIELAESEISPESSCTVNAPILLIGLVMSSPFKPFSLSYYPLRNMKLTLGWQVTKSHYYTPQNMERQSDQDFKSDRINRFVGFCQNELCRMAWFVHSTVRKRR